MFFPYQVQEVYARKEVILAAGAIGSPQILMLSGIGDPKELSEFQVKTNYAWSIVVLLLIENLQIIYKIM